MGKLSTLNNLTIFPWCWGYGWKKKKNVPEPGTTVNTVPIWIAFNNLIYPMIALCERYSFHQPLFCCSDAHHILFIPHICASVLFFAEVFALAHGRDVPAFRHYLINLPNNKSHWPCVWVRNWYITRTSVQYSTLFMCSHFMWKCSLYVR